MKVVCIILLFVIAAGGTDTNQEMKAEGPSTSSQTRSVELKFPKFIKKPLIFANQLIKLCDKDKETYSSNDHVAINDRLVDFKNCTFICKYKDTNVTKKLPESTPCGPDNQTCAKPEECVGGLPGC
uniref:Putative ixodes 8-cys protein n=1 Tax=Ixodes ricinus TaxID=34613 RepID=A0A0K8RB94_IXORI